MVVNMIRGAAPKEEPRVRARLQTGKRLTARSTTGEWEAYPGQPRVMAASRHPLSPLTHG